METTIWHPVVQFGFAGFCGIQFLILVWMMKALLAIVRESTKAIVESTEAIRNLNHKADDALGLGRDIQGKLQSRPCIASKEEGAH